MTAPGHGRAEGLSEQPATQIQPRRFRQGEHYRQISSAAGSRRNSCSARSQRYRRDSPAVHRVADAVTRRLPEVQEQLSCRDRLCDAASA